MFPPLSSMVRLSALYDANRFSRGIQQYCWESRQDVAQVVEEFDLVPRTGGDQAEVRSLRLVKPFRMGT
jgi:hypothetical protein